MRGPCFEQSVLEACSRDAALVLLVLDCLPERLQDAVVLFHEQVAGRSTPSNLGQQVFHRFVKISDLLRESLTLSVPSDFPLPLPPFGRVLTGLAETGEARRFRFATRIRRCEVESATCSAK